MVTRARGAVMKKFLSFSGINTENSMVFLKTSVSF